MVGVIIASPRTGGRPLYSSSEGRASPEHREFCRWNSLWGFQANTWIGQEMGVSLLEEGAFPGKRRDQPSGLLQKCVERGVNPDHPWVSHFLGIKGVPGPGVVRFWVESWIIPGGKGTGMCGEEGKGMESHRQWIFLGFGKVGWKLGKNSGCCGHQGCPGVAALKYSSMLGLENIP